MIVLDLKSNKPIYEQIVEQMKFHVLKGHLKPGDAIPSVRKLALDIAITPGTVAKAYQELERQHIIETIRGKGTFIAQQLTLQQDKAAVEKAKVNLESVLMEFKLLGVDTQQMIEITTEIYESL